MSALRTFLTLGVGLIAGGVVGAYAMTVVYGDRSAALEPTRMQCPPCPVVTSPTPCPAQPDDATGPAASASPTPETIVADAPEIIDTFPEGRLPGLPASALRLASGGMAREVEVCVAPAREAGLSGAILLDLTVTSTSNMGHIRTVELVRADPAVAHLGPCLTEAAHRVHFEWRDEDGESRLRFPIAITAPSP